MLKALLRREPGDIPAEFAIVKSWGTCLTTYIIFDGEYVKIGRSYEPLRRLMSIKANNPRTIIVLALLPGDQEKELFEQYDKYHHCGEWFKLPTDEIEKLLGRDLGCDKEEESEHIGVTQIESVPRTQHNHDEVAVTVYPDGRLDAENAAIYLGLKPKTLAMMRSAGTGPSFVKRGRVFYFRDDLDAWLRGGNAASTAEAMLQRARACK